MTNAAHIITRVLYICLILFCMAVYMYYTWALDINSIDTLAQLFSTYKDFLVDIINLLFIAIVAVVLGVFIHYMAFELKEEYFLSEETVEKIKAPIQEIFETKNREELKETQKSLEDDPTLFASILKDLVVENFSSHDRLLIVFREMMDNEFDRVRKNEMYLSLASVLAPSVGFLGTAIGMVAAFKRISVAGTNVPPWELAGDIQIALITTVMGLIIKAIAMIFHTIVKRKIFLREHEIIKCFKGLFT